MKESGLSVNIKQLLIFLNKNVQFLRSIVVIFFLFKLFSSHSFNILNVLAYDEITRMNNKIKSNFHCTRVITLRRVTSGGAAAELHSTEDTS